MGESHKHSKRSQNQLKMYDFTYVKFFKRANYPSPQKTQNKKTENKCVKEMEKLEPLCTASRNVVAVENNMVVPQNVKHRIAI